MPPVLGATLGSLRSALDAMTGPLPPHHAAVPGMVFFACACMALRSAAAWGCTFERPLHCLASKVCFAGMMIVGLVQCICLTTHVHTRTFDGAGNPLAGPHLKEPADQRLLQLAFDPSKTDIVRRLAHALRQEHSPHTHIYAQVHPCTCTTLWCSSSLSGVSSQW